MQLFRELGLVSSTALVVGNIIGIGIFTTSGLVAQELGASFWVFGVWLLGGSLALTGAICYSLLGRRIPKAGGEYAFLLPFYGPFPAFLSGWASLLIGFSAPIAASALGLAFYLRPLLALPEEWADSGVKATAAIAVLAVSLLLSLGLRFGAGLHAWVAAFNLGLALVFAGLILRASDPSSHLQPLLSGGWAETTSSSLATSVLLVMFTYSGWNAAVYVAEEIKTPKRTLPIALILGTVLVMGVYLLINLAYFSAAPLSALRGQIPVAEIAAGQALGVSGAQIVTLLISVSILSSLTAMSIAGPRVYFAMARNRLFPGWLSEVDSRLKIPLKAIWFQSGIAVLLILLGTFYQILLFSGSVLVLFSLLTVSALFRVGREGQSPLLFGLLYRVLPGIFVGVNGLVLFNAALNHSREFGAGLITIAAGIPVFLYYRRRAGEIE